jgi:CTP synthase
MKGRKKDMKDWENLAKIIRKTQKEVKIGIIGKYFGSGDFILTDSYISVIEAIKHAAFFWKRKPEIRWIDAEDFEKNPKELSSLRKFDGIIVPGGFGSRGVEGKINAIEFCRKQKIPYLGLCLGMQMAVIEFARNVCGLKKANSSEFTSTRTSTRTVLVDKVGDEDKSSSSPFAEARVIDVMPEQKALLKEKRYGGTMRLGAYLCELKPKTLSFRAYFGSKSPKPGQKGLSISERHRHRYELNNEFREVLERRGMVIAGINPERQLVEIIELKNHPFFVATQFHPEFKSRPLRPHPLFREFIRAAIS